MTQTVILDPAASSGTGAQRPWKALDTLHGKVVAFIDNSKPNFSQLADAIAEVVKTRYGVASIIKHSKRAPTMGATEAVFADVVAHCDLVITGSGD